MARIRTIKPEFFTSEDIVELTMPARLLYIALWCEADRDGRMVWKPKTFKLRYFPADSIDIEAVAQELLSGGLVVLYGNGLAHIPQFSKHQHVNPRESQSTLAPPPGALVTKNDAPAPAIDACPRVTDASVTRGHATVTHREEGKGREGEGKEGQEREQRALASEAVPDPPPPREPSPEGDTCRRLIKLGIPQVNPSHPALLDLLRDGATPEGIEQTAAELAQRGRAPGFKLVLATVRGRMEDVAAGITTGRGIRAPPTRATISTPLPEPGSYGQSDFPDDWTPAQAAS